MTELACARISSGHPLPASAHCPYVKAMRLGICDRPDDITKRLILADRYNELGETARELFIRNQIEFHVTQNYGHAILECLAPHYSFMFHSAMRRRLSNIASKPCERCRYRIGLAESCETLLRENIVDWLAADGVGRGTFCASAWPSWIDPVPDRLGAFFAYGCGMIGRVRVRGDNLVAILDSMIGLNPIDAVSVFEWPTSMLWDVYRDEWRRCTISRVTWAGSTYEAVMPFRDEAEQGRLSVQRLSENAAVAIAKARYPSVARWLWPLHAQDLHVLNDLVYDGSPEITTTVTPL